MTFTMVQHPIGRLSQCAVLDVGLKCPHSCEFCYYSFLDGSEDQFRGMRTATFRPVEECKKALDFFAARGFERIDITGGEPMMHPDIFEIVRYAETVADLRVRVITLAQLLGRNEKQTGKPLLDALIEDAGLTDLLISLHAVDPDLYHKMTKGHFSRVEQVLDNLDGRGFSYCTNTVACASNAEHLPAIAEYLVETKRRVYVSNFITMNAYMAWSGRAFGVQARYSDLAGPLRRATRTLESFGVGVNVRYGPYCGLKGLEKNLVGISGVVFDPFEWRNSTRNPFVVLAEDEDEAFALQRRQLPMDHKEFPERCGGCSVRGVCDGVDSSYLREHGEGEIQPYSGVPVTDVVHFRRQNPTVFLQKHKTSRMTPETAGVLSGGAVSGFDWRSLAVGLHRIYEHKLHRRQYLAELGFRSTGSPKPDWADATEWTGKPNRALLLPPGSAAEFRAPALGHSSFQCQVRTVGQKTGRGTVAVTIFHDGDTIGVRRSLPVNGKWKQIQFPLRPGSSALRLRIGRDLSGDSSGDASSVAILEPCLHRSMGAGYAVRLALRNLRYLGLRACLKKVRAWAHCGVREVQAG